MSNDEWGITVSRLQKQIGEKLKAIHFLNTGEDDTISHHLAEASYIGSTIADRLVPDFLQAEGIDLGNAAVDLICDLKELKEAIESMDEDLVRLMNHLNP